MYGFRFWLTKSITLNTHHRINSHTRTLHTHTHTWKSICAATCNTKLSKSTKIVYVPWCLYSASFFHIHSHRGSSKKKLLEFYNNKNRTKTLVLVCVSVSVCVIPTYVYKCKNWHFHGAKESYMCHVSQHIKFSILIYYNKRMYVRQINEYRYKKKKKSWNSSLEAKKNI